MHEGQRVKVKPQHKWRGNSKGTIIELHTEGTLAGRFTVLFDLPGIGFNSGMCLILGEEDVVDAGIDE